MSSSPPLPTPQWVFIDGRDPPVYSRPMVGSEHYTQKYWSSLDATTEVCIGINFTSSLKAEELKDRARSALDKLRFLCPIIACTVEGAEPPRWVYTPSASRDAWLNLAFAVEERGTSLNPSGFIQSINLKRLPYVDANGTTTIFRAYILTTSNESEGIDGSREYGLYFHGSHSILDAGPALYALNMMCEWISGEGMDVKIEHSEEWKNLPVGPVTATGGPSKEWGAAGTKLVQEFAEQSARTTPCHNLAPPSCRPNGSHPPFCCTIAASEAETTAVIAETKKLGISVSALVLAAYCLAQVKMNPVPKGDDVDFSLNHIIVSLERYMKPYVDLKTHLVSTFTLMPLRFSLAQILMESDEKKRLIMTTKILQERFNRYLSDPCLPHLVAGMMSQTAVEKDNDTESTSQAEAEETPLPWLHAFNNLGDVERWLKTQHGCITIGSLGIGIRGKSFLIAYTWTMHSKLHFHIQGAPAWGEENMKMLTEEMRRIGLLILNES